MISPCSTSKPLGCKVSTMRTEPRLNVSREYMRCNDVVTVVPCYLARLFTLLPCDNKRDPEMGCRKRPQKTES